MATTPVRPPATAPINLVSVGIVAFNEEGYLEHVLADLVAQRFPHDRIEVLLVNSHSTDGTRAIMERFVRDNDLPSHGFACVQVLSNPRRIIPCGWNEAIRHFHGDALIRVDAHARIPENFIESNVEVLAEGEYVCGGPRPTIESPSTPWTKTLLSAEESAFGSSVADYRSTSSSKEYVSAVFMPAIRREVIETIGRYDDRLERTEDNDFCYRIREAGYRIRFDTRIQSQQIARGTLRGMLRQKYGNGYWIGRTLHVQPRCLRPYHFAPLAFVLALMATALIGVFTTWIPLAIIAGLYFAVCIALSIYTIIRSEKHPQMLLLPVIFFCIHVTYGLGTLVGFIRGIGRGF